jgi:hypothetical protein
MVYMSMCVCLSGRPSRGIHVSLFRARGLKVKNAQTKAKGWLLATTIPKIYVNVRRTEIEASLSLLVVWDIIISSGLLL